MGCRRRCGRSWAGLINRFGGFVLPYLLLYLTRNGYAPAQAGLAVSAYGVGRIAASVAGGMLADQWGRRRTITLSMLGSASGMLALGLARSLPLIVALAALGGLAAELYRPAASALLADLIPAGKRVTGYAVYRFAVNAGVAFGTVAAGLLATHSFAFLFVGDALTSLLYGVIAVVALPSTSAVRSAAMRPAVEQLVTKRLDLRFTIFLLASAMTAAVYYQCLSTLGLQVGARGLTPATYGMLLSFNGLLIIACELPVTVLTQRLPPAAAMALGRVLIGLGFGLTALATSGWGCAATVALWSLGEMVNQPVASAYVADIAPALRRGRYQGWYGVATGGG